MPQSIKPFPTVAVDSFDVAALSRRNQCYFGPELSVRRLCGVQDCPSCQVILGADVLAQERLVFSHAPEQSEMTPRPHLLLLVLVLVVVVIDVVVVIVVVVVVVVAAAATVVVVLLVVVAAAVAVVVVVLVWLVVLLLQIENLQLVKRSQRSFASHSSGGHEI